jgi:hypothetical protein
MQLFTFKYKADLHKAEMRSGGENITWILTVFLALFPFWSTDAVWTLGQESNISLH